MVGGEAEPKISVLNFPFEVLMTPHKYQALLNWSSSVLYCFNLDIFTLKKKIFYFTLDN